MNRWSKAGILTTLSGLVLAGCGFTPYDLPLPGGADVGDDPYDVTIEFRDALDLVPQSGVRVNDLPVGRVTNIELDGDEWNAVVTVRINGDVELPANAVATIRQTSILGEKFVSIDPPPAGAAGRLEDGAHIPLDRSGRNPEIEEVLAAASLLLNGGGLERTRTIVQELNATLGGRSDDVKSLVAEADTLLGQLDDNSDTIVTTLEKVNDLSQTVNDRTDTLEAALRELPDALRVLDDQREDIVALLESLDDLSDVATDVIETSQDDVIASLEELAPTLRALADTGDELTESLGGFVSFPFTDGWVGETLQEAQDTHVGDFGNLSIRLELSEENLSRLLGLNLVDRGLLDLSDLAVLDDLGGLEDLLGGLFGGLDLSDPQSALDGMGTVPGSGDLLELNDGIVPQSATGGGSEPAPDSEQSDSGRSSESEPPAQRRPANDLCTVLLNLCRTPAGGQ